MGCSRLQRRTVATREFGLFVRGARPEALEASPIIARHEEAAALEAAKTQLKSPTAEATLKVKNQHFADHDNDSSQKKVHAAVRQAIQVKQQGQSSRAAQGKGGGVN